MEIIEKTLTMTLGTIASFAPLYIYVYDSPSGQHLLARKIILVLLPFVLGYAMLTAPGGKFNVASGHRRYIDFLMWGGALGIVIFFVAMAALYIYAFSAL